MVNAPCGRRLRESHRIKGLAARALRPGAQPAANFRERVDILVECAVGSRRRWCFDRRTARSLMGDVVDLERKPTVGRWACACGATEFTLWRDGHVHCTRCGGWHDQLVVVVSEQQALRGR